MYGGNKLKEIKRFLPLILIVLCCLMPRMVVNSKGVQFYLPNVIYCAFASLFRAIRVCNLPIICFEESYYLHGEWNINFFETQIISTEPLDYKIIISFYKVAEFTEIILHLSFFVVLLLVLGLYVLRKKNKGFESAANGVALIYLLLWIPVLWLRFMDVLSYFDGRVGGSLPLVASYLLPYLLLYLVGIGLSLFFFVRALIERIKVYAKRGKE